MILIPIRTVSALNSREHHKARARRVKAERDAVFWMLLDQLKPKLPCIVVLTRIAPSRGLDPFDNLPSSLKGCADQVAQWLGVDDRHDDRVCYECRQKRGPWGVSIEFLPYNAS
jgi:hypothetical protein